MRRFIFVCLLFLPSLLSAGSPTNPFAYNVEMVSGSLTSDTFPVKPIISGNGRYVAFEKRINWLDPTITAEERCKMVSIYDRQNQTTQELFHREHCGQNDLSISGDGWDIVFETLTIYGDQVIELYEPRVGASGASISFTVEGFFQYLDPSTNNITSPSPAFSPDISADGNYVAFEAVKDGQTSIYVADVRNHSIEPISGAEAPDGDSEHPSISGDGRYVAFASTTSNLVPGGYSGQKEIFVHDRQTHTTERVSVGVNGERPNADSDQPDISVSGRFVAFQSDASNLDPHGDDPGAGIFVYDRERHATQYVPNITGGNRDWDCRYPAIAESWFVVFQCGTDGRHFDIFVHDLRHHTTQTVITGYDDNGTNPSISADAQWVAFQSSANNLVPGDTDNESDIFVVNVITTHLECRDHACTAVTGVPMPDLCMEGRNDCGEEQGSGKRKAWNFFKDILSKKPYHLECRNNACVSVKGKGPNTCKTNANCKGKRR